MKTNAIEVKVERRRKAHRNYIVGKKVQDTWRTKRELLVHACERKFCTRVHVHAVNSATK